MPLRQLLALVAPPRCGLCAAPCATRDVVCAACRARLARLGPLAGAVPGLDAVWSAAPYDGVARELVGRLKFGRRLPLADTAAAAIATAAPAGLLAGSLVPVPPAPARRRRRGFDPAGEIAARLGRRTGLPLSDCLRRGDGPRQVGRSRADRLADGPRTRLARPAPAVAVLVDDVLTTGSTLGACARALRAGGARRVAAVTFAQSSGRPAPPLARPLPRA